MSGRTLRRLGSDADQAHLIANRSRHVVSLRYAKLRDHPA